MSKNKKSSGLGKFALGAALGAGLGLLFAPKKGSDLRADLKKKFDEMLEKVKEIDVEEVKDEFEVRIKQLQADLAELDKETVLKAAKKQVEKIQSKAEELVEYAVEKGTPVLEKTANSIRMTAIKATKEVLVKLEGEK